MSEQEITVKDKAPIAMDRLGVQFHSVEDAFRMAQAIVDSGMAPKGDNPQAVMVKMQAGMELGMTPIQSMQSFVVVNGRLTMYGEAALGKIRASGVFDHLVIGNDGEGDARFGFVEFKRRDMASVERVTFTWAEAKKAGLSNKDTYKSWGDDMLVWRAVGRFSKRYASDVLRGFAVAVVIRDHVELRPVKLERTPAAPAGPDPLLIEAGAFDPSESARVDAEIVEAERGKLL